MIKSFKYPCINEISPEFVFNKTKQILAKQKISFNDHEFQETFPTLSGYTTVYNPIQHKFPWVECITSLSELCDEVVVVDGGSSDGAWEKLQEWANIESKLQVYQNIIDWEDPGWDGNQKTFARALSSKEYLIQLDLDEIVHENDYLKIKKLIKNFPDEADIISLPMRELWGNAQHVTARRHLWKWRLYRNKPNIIHGIPDYDRLVDENTNKVYSKGGSDGCFPIDIMTNKLLPSANFWTDEMDQLRHKSPEQFALLMKQVYTEMPSIWHTSWLDLPRKIKHFKTIWDKGWDVLYNRAPTERFPGAETEEQNQELGRTLYNMGGEKQDAIKFKFKVEQKPPKVLENYLKNCDLIY